jgi:hypothetical protein
MLDQLTHATFASLVGSRFTLRVSETSAIEVELIQADKLPAYAGRNGQSPKREPFALVFRGPREFVLQQRIYSIAQAAFGPEDLFLVPIGPDESGQRYEAVFN